MDAPLATAIFDVERGVTEIWLYDTRTGTGRKAIWTPAFLINPFGRPTPAAWSIYGTVVGQSLRSVRWMELPTRNRCPIPAS